MRFATPNITSNKFYRMGREVFMSTDYIQRNEAERKPDFLPLGKALYEKDSPKHTAMNAVAIINNARLMIDRAEQKITAQNNRARQMEKM